MISEPRSILGALAAGLLLVAALRGEARAQAAAPVRAGGGDEAVERVRANLVVGPGESAEEIADRLVQLGTLRVPAMFQLLRGAPSAAPAEAAGPPGPAGTGPAGTGTAGTGPAGAGTAGTGTAAAVLEPVQREALLAALKRLPIAWRSLLEQLAKFETDSAERAAALDLVAQIGEARDLELLFALARAPAGAPSASGAAASAPAAATTAPGAAAPAFAAVTETAGSDPAACGAALERLLGRDAAALARVGELFTGLDPDLQPPVVRAVAAQPSVAALELLSRVLGVRGELDQLVLTELGRCATRLAPPFETRVGDAVRGYLKSASVDLVREAALAAGRLEDVEALAPLVALLSHANRGVRQNAHWSLQRISGLSFAPDPRAWTPWLEAEAAWWKETAPRLFERIDTASLPYALAAVQEVARRRYPRHPLAVELAKALTHREREVRRLTCVALGQFRSRTAVPGLIAALDDPEPEVRKASARALRAITGLELPPVRAAWARAGL